MKPINWIRSHALNHHLFKLLLWWFWKWRFSFGFPHGSLLAVTWESFNALLQTARSFSAQRNGITRIQPNASLFQRYVHSYEWPECIYSRENHKHVEMLQKLKCFQNYIFSVRNLSNFPSLEEMVNDEESLIPSVCKEIVDHLKTLSKSFHGYFGGGELETSAEWIINPYSFNLNRSDDEVLKEDLIELRTNPVLEMQFESKTLE